MLTDDQVRDILTRRMSQREFAKLYRCSRSLISDIQCARAYVNVPDRLTNLSSGLTDRRVLVIGDLHHPFCLNGYLEFCYDQYERFECDTVVFVGDVIDNHYPSYHETDPDGLSGADELDLAISHVRPWVEAFPQALITIGNHDRMVMRKAFSGGIPKKWIKDYNEILEAPGWQFVDELVIDNVQYVHGEGGTARVKAKNDKFSTVQGHLHTQAYIETSVGRDSCVWGMQVGCGVDRRAYAMAYAKTGPKPAIGCAVVLDAGRLPIQIMANLEEHPFV